MESSAMLPLKSAGNTAPAGRLVPRIAWSRCGAYIFAKIASGADLLVQVRTNQVRAKQVPVPFYKRPKK